MQPCTSPCGPETRPSEPLPSSGLITALACLKQMSLYEQVKEQRYQFRDGRLTTWLINVSNSLQYLKHVQRQMAILNYYRQGFPNQWLLSAESAVCRPDTLHTERELEFFDLIREEWFPFPEPEDEFIASIPVYPLGFDYWNYQLDDLSPLYVILCGLRREWHSWDECLSEVHPTLRCPRPVEQIDQGQLKALCETLDTPLKHLFDALTVFQFETGNVFLDSTVEFEMDYYPWSWENLAMLRREFEAAARWQEKFTALEEWLMDDLSRVRALVELWNQCAVDQKERGQPLIQTVSSRQFVEGIDLRAQAGRYQSEPLQPTD